MLAHEAQHLARRALLGLEGEPQVGPVEAAHEDARRRGEQLVDDVAARRRVGGRGQRQGLQPAADLARDVAQREVLGAEIVAPLRDAMRLVDRHQRDVDLGQHLDRVGPRQPLGREVEQTQLARGAAGRARAAFSAGSLLELRLPAATPAALSARTWSRISAISGETTSVRPGRASAGSW